MKILLTNFFVCLLLALVAILINMQFAKRGTQFFLFTSFILLLLIYSFSDPMSTCDLPSYKETFDSIQFYQVNWNSILDNYMEPGWIILCKIISSTTKNFNIFLFVYGIILLFCYYKTMYKYSHYAILSVLIFILVIFNGSIFILRQNLAMALCIASVPFVISRDFKRFLILVIIAFLLHRTAIIFIPIYFLYSLKTTKQYLILFLSVILASSVFLALLNGFISQSNKYGIYTAEGLTITNFAIASVITFFYIFFLRKEALKEGINRIILISLGVTLCSYIMLLNKDGVFVRLLSYYTTMYILAIPKTAEYIKSTPVRYAYIIGVISSYFLTSFIIGDTSCLTSFKLLF